LWQNKKKKRGWENENEGGRQLRKEEIERKKDREATGTKVMQNISKGFKRIIKGTCVDVKKGRQNKTV
jgi:hypothetical protein